MDPSIIGVVGILVMMLLMAFGMPIAFAMMLTGATGVYFILGADSALHLLSSNLWNSFSDYGLSVIPLFILMGQFAYRSGVTERMYRSAASWCGRLPGGVAATTVFTCAGFGAICGSNAATAATMSTVALPEMKKRGYDKALSAGTVAVGGTLGVVIPPSVVLIVIALQTRQSVTSLFAGAILPALILVSLMVATVVLICTIKPHLGPAGDKVSWRQKFKSLSGLIEVVIIFSLVIGGMLGGFFTPTEAGAVGSAVAALNGLIRGQLLGRNFFLAIEETVRISAMVLMLIVGAVLFGKFLVVANVPFALSDWINSLSVSIYWILLAVMMIYLLGGMFMDSLGFLVVSLPVFFPLALALNLDPVWFSILLMLVTTLGAVSPPVGVCAFIVSNLAPNIKINTVFKGIFYFLPAYIGCIALIIFFPDIISASLSLFTG